MIIDFHTHTYPDRIAAKTVGLLESRSGTRAHSDGGTDKWMCLWYFRWQRLRNNISI